MKELLMFMALILFAILVLMSINYYLVMPEFTVIP